MPRQYPCCKRKSFEIYSLQVSYRQNSHLKILLENVKNFMNKSKAPKVPPLKGDDKFDMNYDEKAKIFNEQFYQTIQTKCQQQWTAAVYVPH